MAGTNNEAQHIFRSQVFHIRSEDGRNYQLDQFGNEVLTGFTIDLFQAIECNHNQSFLVSLASMEFPYSFYTTDLTNNQINVKTQNTGTGLYSATYTVVVPVGNYNASNLKSTLTNLLDSQFNAGVVGASFATTFSIIYDEITNKYTFKTKEADRVGVFTWSSDTPSNPINEQLGCLLTSDTTFDDTAGAESNSVVNVGGARVDALYFRTSMSSTSSIESRIQGVSNVIQKVNVQSPPNSFIFFDTEQVSSKTLITQKEIQSVSIRITDSADRLIDTNSVNFALSIQFDTIRTPAFMTPFRTRRIGEELDYQLAHHAGGQVNMVEDLRKRYAEATRRKRKEVRVRRRDREKEQEKEKKEDDKTEKENVK